MEKLILLYTPETAYFKLFRRLFARWVLFQIAPTNEFISLCQKNGHDPMYHAQADWGVSLARLDTKLQNRLKFKNTFFRS